MVTAPSYDAHPSATQPMRYRNLALMLALFIVTLHFYAFYWYWDTTRALNRQLSNKISAGFMSACFTVTLLALGLLVANQMVASTDTAASWLPTAARAAGWADALLWLGWTLQLRARLNEYTTTVIRSRRHVSLLWAWLFQLFYLQLQINGIVDDDAIGAR